jgi:hypothetical protein
MRGTNTFVVTVCPPGTGGLQEPIGTVEHVDRRRHYTFRGANELMQLLLGRRGSRASAGATSQLGTRRNGRDG